jgi:YVTN family beta-propeller protein
MSRPRNFRVYFLLTVLLLFAVILLLREHRPSFLRPGLHLNAYVSTDDGSITVVDLISLRAIAKVYAGPSLAEILEHPNRAEIWGVSSAGGYVWVLDAPSNQISSRIPVGALPYSLEFSVKGDRAYTTSSTTNQLVAIDCATRAIIGRGKTGVQPVRVRITPDNKTLLVVNSRAATLGIHDAATLQQRAEIPVIADPEEISILPDSSLAFVMSRSQNRLSVVDVRRGVLLTNLVLAGTPSQMILKPDGGELYVISPETHGLQAMNTWTHEMGDYMMLGSAPSSSVITEDAGEMYVADRAAGRVMPLDIVNRRVSRPINVGALPGAMRFDPAEPGAKPAMLLVVNEGSGDLAVLRTRTDSLLTMIPVGSHPQRIAVKLF